jgi:hypothetical protein
MLYCSTVQQSTVQHSVSPAAGRVRGSRRSAWARPDPPPGVREGRKRGGEEKMKVKKKRQRRKLTRNVGYLLDNAVNSLGEQYSVRYSTVQHGTA